MELIDKSETLKAILDRLGVVDDEHLYPAEKRIIDTIKTIPATEKKGVWKMEKDPFMVFDEIPVCSECQCMPRYREKSPYCPNCGARMQGVFEDEEYYE